MITLMQGDCLDAMRSMPDASVDSVVTDPPYGLGFMGKAWDALPPGREWADECLRLLKPGGHLLAFGGTRTWHRLAVAVEDAGFELRDSIAWLYGSGFPKSLDVSKALDRQRDDSADAVRRDVILTVTQWVAQARDAAGLTNRAIDAAFGTNGMAGHWTSAKSQPHVPTATQWPRLLELLEVDEPPAEVRAAVDEWLRLKGQPAPTWSLRPVTGHHERSTPQQTWMANHSDHVALPPKERRDVPATEAARQWQGWGTALKPAFEPVVVGRKPLVGTVAANVLAHGTGALNIDATRIGDEVRINPAGSPIVTPLAYGKRNGGVAQEVTGRWPANVVLDEAAAGELDAQSGIMRDGVAVQRNGGGQALFGGIGSGENTVGARPDAGYGGSGGASRFFYVAKAPKSERPLVNGAGHPTVKPLALMRWLVRLVTPPGGLVLEPFLGSGTTAQACELEGFDCIGIERDPDYMRLALARLTKGTS